MVQSIYIFILSPEKCCWSDTVTSISESSTSSIGSFGTTYLMFSIFAPTHTLKSYWSWQYLLLSFSDGQARILSHSKLIHAFKDGQFCHGPIHIFQKAEWLYINTIPTSLKDMAILQDGYHSVGKCSGELAENFGGWLSSVFMVGYEIIGSVGWCFQRSWFLGPGDLLWNCGAEEMYLGSSAQKKTK